RLLQIIIWLESSVGAVLAAGGLAKKKWSIGFTGGLECAALLIVERVMEKEDRFDAQAECLQPAAKLGKCRNAEPPPEHGAQVLRAQVDFHRRAALQRESQETYRPAPAAHAALMRLGSLYQRLGQAHDQGLLALRAVVLVDDPVPIALRAAAPAAR